MTTEWPHGDPVPLTIEGSDSGDFWHRMRLSGEFDMNGTPRFLAAVREALERGRRGIAVEAAAVTFMDSSGLLALLTARLDVQAVGGTFRLTTVSAPVARLIEIAMLTDQLLDRRQGE
jgi:anti-anti-sigma factor